MGFIKQPIINYIDQSLEKLPIGKGNLENPNYEDIRKSVEWDNNEVGFTALKLIIAANGQSTGRRIERKLLFESPQVGERKVTFTRGGLWWHTSGPSSPEDIPEVNIVGRVNELSLIKLGRVAFTLRDFIHTREDLMQQPV